MMRRFSLTIDPARLVAQNLAVDPVKSATCFAARVEHAVSSAFPGAAFSWELGAKMAFSAANNGEDDEEGALELERLTDAIRKTGGYLVYF